MREVILRHDDGAGLAPEEEEELGRQWVVARETGHQGAGLGDSNVLSGSWCHALKMVHQTLGTLRKLPRAPRDVGPGLQRRPSRAGCSRGDAGGDCGSSGASQVGSDPQGAGLELTVWALTQLCHTLEL